MQMMCVWESVLSVLPVWLRQKVDARGKENLQELRLRINAPPELNFGSHWTCLPGNVSREDLLFCVNTASRYSPWAASTIGKGYLTLSGGHRIGLCGEAIVKEGVVTGIREVRSLNIRIARDFPGISETIPINSSILLLGAPGWGKTTLLRDLARKTADNYRVSVADERGELFPEGFPPGKRMDVMKGCPKSQAIELLLRSMGPEWIAVDEITAESDADALMQAVGCGVRMMATAHAASVQDLRQRPVYRRLLETGVFQTLVVLRPDKTFSLERMPI